MRKLRMLAVGAAAVALLLSACQPGGSSSPSPSSGASSPAELPTVSVGSADFDESAIVAEIYAQALEAAGFTVERHLYFGTRETYVPALESGDLSVVPDYIGGTADALGAQSSADPDETLANLQDALAESGLTAFNYSEGSDSDAFAVTAETAQESNLATMSDIAPIAAQFTWGIPAECAGRELCEIGLRDVYGIDINAIPVENISACSSAMAEAVNANAIQVGRVCTTQPGIAQYNLVVLADDKGLNPAQNIAPLVNADVAAAGGAWMEDALNAVSAVLTTDELIQLNTMVSVDQQALEDVAHQWLTDKGLI